MTKQFLLSALLLTVIVSGKERRFFNRPSRKEGSEKNRQQAEDGVCQHGGSCDLLPLPWKRRSLMSFEVEHVLCYPR